MCRLRHVRRVCLLLPLLLLTFLFATLCSYCILVYFFLLSSLLLLLVHCLCCCCCCRLCRGHEYLMKLASSCFLQRALRFCLACCRCCCNCVCACGKCRRMSHVSMCVCACLYICMLATCLLTEFSN